KPITAIRTEFPNDRPAGRVLVIIWAASDMMTPAGEDGVLPGGAGRTPGRPAKGCAGAGNSHAVEHVRRKQDGGHLAAVDPIMAQAVGLAADVAGLVLDRHRAGRAVLGDRAADGVDQRRPVLVTVERD